MPAAKERPADPGLYMGNEAADESEEESEDEEEAEEEAVAVAGSADELAAVKGNGTL